MKVRPSVKKICEKCKVIKRKGVTRVICETLNINKDKGNLNLLIRKNSAAVLNFRNIYFYLLYKTIQKFNYISN